MSIEKLREQFDSLAGCCLHDRQWSPDDVTAVLARVWRGDESGGWQPLEGEKELSDSESYTVVKLKDGRFGLLGESEDYTGHGCQCESSTAVYGSLDELLKMGIPEEAPRNMLRQASLMPAESGRVTVADITAALTEIEATRMDQESAHRMEDTMWLSVLEAIRDGAPDAAALAAEAVRSCEINFDRWYS